MTTLRERNVVKTTARTLSTEIHKYIKYKYIKTCKMQNKMGHNKRNINCSSLKLTSVTKRNVYFQDAYIITGKFVNMKQIFFIYIHLQEYQIGNQFVMVLSYVLNIKTDLCLYMW